MLRRTSPSRPRATPGRPLSLNSMPPALPTLSTISSLGLERLRLALGQHAVEHLDAVGLHGHPAVLARLQVSTRPAGCAGAAATGGGGGYTGSEGNVQARRRRERRGDGGAGGGGRRASDRSPAARATPATATAASSAHVEAADARAAPAAAPPPQALRRLPAVGEDELGHRALGVEAEVRSRTGARRPAGRGRPGSTSTRSCSSACRKRTLIFVASAMSRRSMPRNSRSLRSPHRRKAMASGRNMVSNGIMSRDWPGIADSSGLQKGVKTMSLISLGFRGHDRRGAAGRPRAGAAAPRALRPTGAGREGRGRSSGARATARGVRGWRTSASRTA